VAQPWPLSVSVFADGFDRAALHRFAALGFLPGVFRLFENERVTLVVGAREVARRGLTAEIAIDALAVHVEFSAYILFVFIFLVCHVCKVVSRPLDAFGRGLLQLQIVSSSEEAAPFFFSNFLIL